MILFCIRKEGDLDNFTPIIFQLSKKYNDKICILSVEPSIDLSKDFRILFLISKSSNILYKNFDKILKFNFFKNKI